MKTKLSLFTAVFILFSASGYASNQHHNIVQGHALKQKDAAHFVAISKALSKSSSQCQSRGLKLDYNSPDGVELETQLSDENKGVHRVQLKVRFRCV